MDRADVSCISHPGTADLSELKYCCKSHSQTIRQLTESPIGQQRADTH